MEAVWDAPSSLLRCKCLFWHHTYRQNQCAPWTSNMFFSSFSSSPLGCVVTVTGRLTFVSNKSMEIEVLVDATSLVEAEKGKYRAVSAFFTFISLDKHNRPLPVPPLKVVPSCVCFLSFPLSLSLFLSQTYPGLLHLHAWNWVHMCITVRSTKISPVPWPEPKRMSAIVNLVVIFGNLQLLYFY